MLFCISVAGIFLNRKNVIVLLMSIELMLLAVNINFVAFSRYLGDPAGQMFVFFILTVAAAEAAIGLAILVTLFRNRRTINVAEIDTLEGLTRCRAWNTSSPRSILLAIVLAPLLGAIIAGLFGRRIGRVGAHSVTIARRGAVSCALSGYVL